MKSATGFASVFWKHELSRGLGLLISPHSFYQALAVLTLQAKPEHRKNFMTAMCLREPNLPVDDFAATVRTLSSDLQSRSDFVLHDVSAVWINSAMNIPEERFAISKTQLSVKVSTVQFPNQAKDMINAFIEQTTDGLLRDFIQDDLLSPDTAFVITNVLYLHGHWVDAFDPERTEQLPFELFSGEEIRVPMMTGQFNVRYHHNSYSAASFSPI
jgi:serpin B